ncbi:glycosyl hydrolase [Arthrobacter sp.]|uniref:glycosyl hydrolase n=1 Tax=Arthrobacter sp. TaxID=1667 RepID=UPI0033949EA7
MKDSKRPLELDALGWVSRQEPQTKTEYQLGFNEPDHKSQANMSVDEASFVTQADDNPFQARVPGSGRYQQPLA